MANGTTATLTIVACTISDNTASGLSGYGGGVANSGTATLANCTISGNSAVDGGGLWNSGAAATLTLTDSTISGNSAGSGGGLWNSGTTATLTLTDCTISGNNATGGGLYNGAYATATLTGTIVAGNTGSSVTSDIAGTAAGEVTGTYNLVGTGGSGGITGGSGGNIVLTTLADLGLAPLADYGGPTQTIALLPGSVAISAGTAVSGITTDQRGEPLDSPPDIGAFQSQGFTITSVAGGTLQQTTDGTAFANPLAVAVTANNPLEPVAGGTLTFAAPSSGASAALTGGTFTLGPDGSASVIAADNSIAGSYSVTASTTGARRSHSA